MGNQEPRLEACTRLARVFDLLGKRWSGLIIDVLMQQPARFSELVRAVPGLSQRVMAQRLHELAEAGLVERTIDPGPPITATYSLTPLGEGLRKPFEGLRRWASGLPDPA